MQIDQGYMIMGQIRPSTSFFFSPQSNHENLVCNIYSSIYCTITNFWAELWSEVVGLTWTVAYKVECNWSIEAATFWYPSSNILIQMHKGYLLDTSYHTLLHTVALSFVLFSSIWYSVVSYQESIVNTSRKIWVKNRLSQWHLYLR
jgi:hypothetical protein